MQAGSARMLVTVRRGYEVPLLFFLAFGYLPELPRAVFTTVPGRVWLGQLLVDNPSDPEECWQLQVPTDQATLVVDEKFARRVQG